MKTGELVLAGGLLAATLTASGCGGEDSSEFPLAVYIQVNCDSYPKDIVPVGFRDTQELVRLGNRIVTFEIADQRESQDIKVRMLGDTVVNGHPVTAVSAGEVVATLPTARLIAGVPNHGAHADEYYAGDEGVTLACNGASPADSYDRPIL
jgi:hypothetical protein